MNQWGCSRPDVFVHVFVDQLKGIALEWAVAANEEMTSTADYVSWQPNVRVHEVNEPGNIVWWLCHWGGGVREFEPLTDWKVLGELFDKYELTVTTTSRDHPDQRFLAFCPYAYRGRGYAADAKTALLRSILLSNVPEEQQLMHAVEVPYDLAVHAKCYISPEQIAAAKTCTWDDVAISVPTRVEPSFEDVAVDNDF